MEAMPLGIVVFENWTNDGGGLISIAANAKFREIVKRESPNMAGVSFQEIFPGCENWQSDIQSRIISSDWSGEIISAEEYVEQPVRKWILIKVYKTAGGNPAMIVEDVTSQSRAKQALRRQRSHITF